MRQPHKPHEHGPVRVGKDLNLKVSFPSTTGTYYYGACVDAVPEESETTNNCSASVQVVIE